MASLPRVVRSYLTLIWLAGALCTAWAVDSLVHISHAEGWVYWLRLVLFLVLVSISATKNIQITPRQLDTNSTGTMSVAFAVSFAAIMTLGPEAGLLCGIATAVSAGLYPGRQAYYQILFNASALACTSLLCGIVYVHYNGGLVGLHGSRSALAIILSTLSYYILNTGMVAGVISLSSGKSLVEVWKSHFLWTAPGYFAGASAASVAVYLIEAKDTLLPLMTLPVLFLIYHSYRTYVDKVEQKEEHIRALQDKQNQLADLYLSTVRSLAMAIDAKDQHTHEHILRVQQYALAIAEEMQLSPEDIDAVRTGSLLHDIGKLGVPEYVLLKPGRLTDDEFEKIKRHPVIGADILSPVNFPWPVIAIVKHHHEKWDGSGYPDGLKGENIPLVARILAVADVYDALTSSRTYRRAWDNKQAKEHIRAASGTHFDPMVVEAFLQVADRVAQQIDSRMKETIPEAPAERTLLPGSTGAHRAAKRIHRANAELWSLYEMTQMVGTGMGVVDTVRLLAGKIVEALGCSTCLFLLQTESGLYSVPEAVGINNGYFRGASLRAPDGDGPIAEVLRTGEPQRVDYDKEELLLTACSAPWKEYVDGIVVPLTHEGSMLGTLNIYHDQAGQFTEEDEYFLMAVARQAAASVYSALLLERTRADAYTDPLTGLANIRAFMRDMGEWLGPELPATDDGITPTFALLYLDLDNFKPINDNFGHAQGDRILQDVASILRVYIRPEDTAIRYGGDEFLVVLPGADTNVAAHVADRLEAAISTEIAGLIHPTFGEVKVGSSIGIAHYPEDGCDLPTLLSVADQRMYQCKTQHKLHMIRTNEGGASISGRFTKPIRRSA
jgi:diguanylate cyclase (GGDEF)-like protein/putative nucleotidyltransferase with HDIG domain